MKYDRRKVKRLINYLSKKIRVGSFYVDCRYHPCRATVADFWKYEGDIEGVSLFDGSPSSCSATHCGPQPITEAQAHEMAAYRKDHDIYEYLKRFMGFTDEAIEYFKEQDKVWGFNKG